jgi:hypothetical protein
MKPTIAGTTCRAVTGQTAHTVLLTALALWGLLTSATGADMYRPLATEGGIDPRATMTSMSKKGTNVTLSWYGLMGKYHALRSPSLTSPSWTTNKDFTAYAYSNSVTIPAGAGSQGFFRMSGDFYYTGAAACASCHGDVYKEWLGTAHATALNDVIAMPASLGCVKCHSVGYGLPSGFVNTNTTPRLANVQCENCHGPAGQHAFGDDFFKLPPATVAAEVCGGCHTDSHHPTYPEWTNSAHAAVTPDVAGGSSGFTNVANGPGRQMSCGPCHSGATRLAMLENYEMQQDGYTNALTLPSGTDAAAFGQTCVVCHEPHATTANAFQLRNPLSSTNFYTFFTGSDTRRTVTTNWDGRLLTNVTYMNTVFATQYVAQVQICAQCHNTRGALWTDTSRPPHGSLQYNMLLGDVGAFLSGAAPYQPSTHARALTNQCVACHMQTRAYQSEATPAITGHNFSVNSFTLCVPCHGPSASNLVDFAINYFLPAQTQQVKAALDLWATTKAPTALRTKYGTRAWEYTNPGTLSSGGSGPTTAEQAQIPDNIKKARFDVYLANNDPASGIHNPLYVLTLVDAALGFVQLELNK